jgi:hypothetical protein
VTLAGRAVVLRADFLYLYQAKELDAVRRLSACAKDTASDLNGIRPIHLDYNNIDYLKL